MDRGLLEQVVPRRIDALDQFDLLVTSPALTMAAAVWATAQYRSTLARAAVIPSAARDLLNDFSLVSSAGIAIRGINESSDEGCDQAILLQIPRCARDDELVSVAQTNASLVREKSLELKT